MNEEVGVRWRVFVHALDRTGPPMLARSLMRWMVEAHPEIKIEIVAFRGGPLAEDLEGLGSVTVVLDDHEPWDAAVLDPLRAGQLRDRLALLDPVSVNLFVSIAAAQVMPLLPTELGPIVTWVVEVGEDFHWFHAPLGLIERTDVFLAGSEASAVELAPLLGPSWPRTVVREFVESPVPISSPRRRQLRSEMGAADDQLLVIGAGIGTSRKGIDLFAEVASLTQARSTAPIVFCWIGGSDDALFPLVAADLGHPELARLRLLPPVDDLGSYLAAADVMVHPARRDAFPLVCVSAAAAETPVVAFASSGGVTELLGDDLAGGVFPETDELASAVIDLSDRQRRNDVGEAQQRRTRSYVASAAAPAFMATVERLVAELGR